MTDKNASSGKPTGAGAEAAEGIHSADRPKHEGQQASTPKPERQGDGDPAGQGARGSEPTKSHGTEHQSNYGGGGENGGSKAGEA